MNAVEEAVLDALREKPASGGKIIERFQAQGSDLFRGRAILVFGALANLARRGQAKVIGEGPGERGSGPARDLRRQNHAETFSQHFVPIDARHRSLHPSIHCRLDE